VIDTRTCSASRTLLCAGRRERGLLRLELLLGWCLPPRCLLLLLLLLLLLGFFISSSASTAAAAAADDDEMGSAPAADSRPFSASVEREREKERERES
jgi:hypothetical protein